MIDIDINEYDYDLPEERIAQYPASERDMSNLLIFRENRISKDVFRNIAEHIPSGSLLVFNNTRVIRARLLFVKETGAAIEILCLEPLEPADYESSFSSRKPVEWKCIAGNLRKWKSGRLAISFSLDGKACTLFAWKGEIMNDTLRVRFEWDNTDLSFGEVIEAAGHMPLPPYINREDECEDYDRYQTVYSRIKGSVAAPTAGLHFTGPVFDRLSDKGIGTAELTLHVGAGTFQPVKSDNIAGHSMHCEHFFISRSTLATILTSIGSIIAVGTTSVRTLESLYWMGVSLIREPVPDINELSLSQWDPYRQETEITAREALEALLRLMENNGTNYLHGSTSVIIVPGYRFRTISGMITNFHQPRSTLLLLISAWLGVRWKEVYDFALGNGFRFLSYGDSSLLLK